MLPVTAKVLEVVLKVKLVEVPMTLVPWPNKMPLAVRFWSWMVGVVPPEERMEPEPLTAVTVPAAVVVAIIFPFWSTAKTEEVKPLPKESWEMVVVARVEVPVMNAGPETVKPVVEAFCKLVLPETVRMLEIVVEPVTAKVLEFGLKVKLVEVARGLVPLPKRMSLAVTAWLPVPPLATGNTPVTLLPPRAMALAVICCPERLK